MEEPRKELPLGKIARRPEEDDNLRLLRTGSRVHRETLTAECGGRITLQLRPGNLWRGYAPSIIVSSSAIACC